MVVSGSHLFYFVSLIAGELLCESKINSFQCLPLQPERNDMQFSDLKLNKQLLNALEANGYAHPTPIQQKAFSPIMSGRDVVGLAQTGTGKTLAYLLPLLNMWKFTKSPYPQILIIVPTRELVLQVVEQIELLTERINLVVGGAYGGANIKRQISMLEMGMDVLVATPGRLYDLLLKGGNFLKVCVEGINT